MKPEPPVGSPFPSAPPAGSPFPNGAQPPSSPFPSGPPTPYTANPYEAQMPAPNVRTNQGWGWNALIGITYNGFPVGIVVAVVVGLLYLASN